MKSPSPRKGSINILAVLFVLAVALLLAGCGSGGGSSSSEGATTAAKEGSKSSQNFDPLEKTISEVETEPKMIPARQPLPSKPKPGEKMIFLQCDIPQCQQLGDGVKEASEAVGWTYEAIAFKSAEPASLIEGMKEALEKDPVAVAFTGGPEATWSQMKPAFEEAGVGMIPMFIGPVKEQDPIWGNVANLAQNEWIGKVLASWFIVNSEGSGSALIQAIPAFASVTEWVDAFKSEVEANCSECSVKELETSIAEVTGGPAVSSLTSALQSDPSIKYAFVYNGAFIPGATAELKNAGISDVKLGGWAATSEYINDELNGSDYAWIGANNQYSGWLAVDYALRHLEGAALKPEETLLPAQLITTKNATSELAEIADKYGLPDNYGEQFEELWGVK